MNTQPTHDHRPTFNTAIAGREATADQPMELGDHTTQFSEQHMAPRSEPDANPPDLGIADTLRALADRLDHTAQYDDSPATIAQRTVQAFLDAYRTGDLDTAAALTTTDLVYRIPGHSAISGTFQGASGLHALGGITPRSGARGLAETTDLVAPAPDGSTVATYHTLTATLDSAPITIELTLRFDLAHGRISRITEYSHHQHLTDDLFNPDFTPDQTPPPTVTAPPLSAVSRIRRRITRRATTADSTPEGWASPGNVESC